jgi:hypothetical protein
MKIPPMFVSLKFGRNKGESLNRFRLWVPLFVVVPIMLIILLAMFLVALPFMIISVIFSWNLRWWHWLALHVRAFFETCNALGGLEIELADGSKEVYIAFH